MSEEIELDFDKVLEKDLANIVKKASAGAPLTARERALIEAEKSKRAKPTAPKAAPRVRPKAKSGRSAMTGYVESYQWYAARYGSARRTVMRWVKTGKEMQPDPILCPLDEPTKMRGWWAACMTQRCPPGIIAAEIAALNAGEEVEDLKEELEPDDGLDLGDEVPGLAGTMGRLEKMELHLARKADQPGQAKPWLDTISRMTSTAANLRKELQAQGKLVLRAEAAMEIQSFHGQIVSVLKGFLSEEQYREIFEFLKKEVFE